MNDDLVTHLVAIDERLLDYLSEEKELPAEVVTRLQRYTNALVEGSTTAELVVDEWADYFDLASAFVVAYGTDELQDLYDQASFVGAVHEGRVVALTDADRVFLVTLAEELDRYMTLHRHR
jgi:hypothetical protein